MPLYETLYYGGIKWHFAVLTADISSHKADMWPWLAHIEMRRPMYGIARYQIAPLRPSIIAEILPDCRRAS